MAAVSRKHEKILFRQGIEFIAGVDESGIGPLAGPVVAAAVIMPLNIKIKGIDDSKKLCRRKREELFHIILSSSISLGIGIVDNPTIDKINILQASFKAMSCALDRLNIEPQHVLIDGIRKVPSVSIPQTTIKHGDRISFLIAAASIVAKVMRDKLMDNYDHIYPQYGFSRHKGYGTAEHMRSLRKFGPSPIHRLSYQPVTECLSSKGFLCL